MVRKNWLSNWVPCTEYGLFRNSAWCLHTIWFYTLSDALAFFWKGESTSGIRERLTNFALARWACAICGLWKLCTSLFIPRKIIWLRNNNIHEKYEIAHYLTNREALTVLCSVVKHAGSGACNLWSLRKFTLSSSCNSWSLTKFYKCLFTSNCMKKKWCDFVLIIYMRKYQIAHHNYAKAKRAHQVQK